MNLKQLARDIQPDQVNFYQNITATKNTLYTHTEKQSAMAEKLFLNDMVIFIWQSIAFVLTLLFQE